jgi:hypothetical protein
MKRKQLNADGSLKKKLILNKKAVAKLSNHLLLGGGGEKSKGVAISCDPGQDTGCTGEPKSTLPLFCKPK